MYITNHAISNLISKMNYGVQKRLRFLNIEKDSNTLKLLRMLYINGVIRSYRILDNRRVSVYFKYYLCNKVFKITTVSTPGNRIYCTLIYKLPSYYFYSLKNNYIKLLFLKKFFYISFVKHFFMLLKKISYIFSVRLRVKGLGYRIRKISNYLYYFFFNYTNMFYF